MALDREVRRLLYGLDEKLANRTEIEPLAFDKENRSHPGDARTITLVRNDERPTFFDYQEDLVSRMSGILCNGGTALLSLPTGAGKTRTAVSALLEARRRLAGLRICWVAPTYELLDQALSASVQLWKQFGAAPDMRIAMMGAPVAAADLWLTTPQTVASRARRAQPLGEWQGVIFDEAHQMAAPTFRAAVDALRHQSTSRALVGLSATPGRSSEKETDVLIELFQGNLLTSSRLGLHPVEELQRRGVLSQVRFRPLSKREPSSLDEIERLKIIFRACCYLARRSRRVLVFTSSVAAAQALSLALANKQVAASWVAGSMPPNERISRLQSFAAGMTQVLANQRLLATGYDCPAVTDVIIQTRVSSAILFEQIVGRVARGPLIGGARVGTVWQFEDHLFFHGLPQSYYRYRDYDWT